MLFVLTKDTWIMISYTKNMWIMSSYAHFATPTCRQAMMQTYRVCWRLEATVKQCFSEKAVTKKYYTSVVSSITYCISASTLSHQTTNSIHSYRGFPTSGRAKMGVTTYYTLHRFLFLHRFQIDLHKQFYYCTFHTSLVNQPLLPRVDRLQYLTAGRRVWPLTHGFV